MLLAHFRKSQSTAAVECFCHRRLFPSLTSAQLIFLSSKNLWLHLDFTFTFLPDWRDATIWCQHSKAVFPSHKFYFVSFYLTALASQADFWCFGFYLRTGKVTKTAEATQKVLMLARTSVKLHPKAVRKICASQWRCRRSLGVNKCTIETMFPGGPFKQKVIFYGFLIYLNFSNRCLICLKFN